MTDTATPVAANPTICTFLDISTGHVTEDVMQGITSVAGVIADRTPYGAWMWVPSDVEEWVDEHPGQVPRCVIDIWTRARSQGCDFVHLDCDAGADEGLPTYDW